MAPGTCIKVIFRARVKESIPAEFIQRIRHEAQQIPGFLGLQVSMNGDQETAISYWQHQTAIDQWAENPVHQTAKAAKDRFYSEFSLELLPHQPIPPEFIK